MLTGLTLCSTQELYQRMSPVKLKAGPLTRYITWCSPLKRSCTKKSVEEHVKINEQLCRIVKWYGAPNTFFGFGLGKLLAPFQREKSIRRGQMIRYADIAAYPKLLIEEASKIDDSALLDPRENRVVTFKDNKPEYLQPPQISQIVGDTNNLADQDAQQASGLMDISNGSQSSSTVDTATGQSIFADAAEKRVRKAKRR